MADKLVLLLARELKGVRVGIIKDNTMMVVSSEPWVVHPEGHLAVEDMEVDISQFLKRCFEGVAVGQMLHITINASVVPELMSKEDQKFFDELKASEAVQWGKNALKTSPS